MNAAAGAGVIRPQWLAVEPLERAHALAAPLYTDPAVLALEQRRVFARGWQLFAPAAAVAATGDHAVGEIGGTPVIVVRGEDGALRAFHNVCRHRGGPLAFADGRGAKALHCKYHGWTYTLAGQLRSAPEMQEAQQFDVKAVCLPPARAVAWQGLVFAALEPEADLGDVLGGIAEQAPATFGRPLQFARRVTYELACNWKVYVDNYLEGYHLPHIHPGLNQLLDYRSYTTTLARWHSLQHSPLEDTGNFYGPGGAHYFFVWPNTMLNCLPGRLQTNRVLPLGVDRCRIEFDYYYPAGDGADAAELQRREHDQRFSDGVQAEDAAICAAVQRGLASGSYVPGRLNPRREAGVKHFHDLLRAAYATGWPA